MKRRNFIKTTGLVTAGIGVAGSLVSANSMAVAENKIPRWKGFNILDYFSPSPSHCLLYTSDAADE